MRLTLIAVLMRLVHWLRGVDPAVQRARALVAWADTLNVSGERKRRQVYQRLVEEFPTIAKRHLGLLIEELVQERG